MSWRSRSRSLHDELAAVRRGERQLRAIALADAALERKSRRLERILQPDVIAAHVTAALAAAPLRDDPFPYAVVDDLLPAAFYDALIEGLPPAELFSDRAINKQQLIVPLELGPAYSRRVWGFMADTVVPEMIAPAVLEKFRAHASAWLTHNFPAAGDDPLDAIAMTCSDGRILLRRPGYYIPPHRDPKWGFLTCLMYLARPGDSERWRTQLHRVAGDEEARGAQPHWIDEQRCEPVEHIAFRRNRALIFLNSVGAHSARIPGDADPPTLNAMPTSSASARAPARSERWCRGCLPIDARRGQERPRHIERHVPDGPSGSGGELLALQPCSAGLVDNILA